ncbi:MAG: tRNA epoxyqueuosine(34) reductase QueG, partial [Thiomicrospira sp.]|nr:tRNA epoxyqueuosine(34) reductase QueG [Thiomicrospira sp.]
MNHSLPPTTLAELSRHIKQWAQQLGFADCGICDIDLSRHENDYFNWINLGYHGEMQYMVQHGTKRTRPAELIPGTRRVISLRMNYFEQQAQDAITQLKSPHHAYISRYALGRDYHKLIRQRLKQLCQRIAEHYPQAAQRIFVDSAPVLERPLAQKAGLGFIGKNSLLIHPRAGSW